LALRNECTKVLKNKHVVFLIGPMGCGKSTVGKILAADLKYSFSDSDEEIEILKSMSIQDIFRKYGEGHFRLLEHGYLHTISDQQQKVIATGGGMPCFYENIALMKNKGLVIYLELPLEVMFTRLQKEVAKRPLLIANEDWRTTLAQLFEARKSFYHQAHYVVDANMQVNEIVDSIVNLVRLEIK
jgi:shikimate kinase